MALLRAPTMCFGSSTVGAWSVGMLDACEPPIDVTMGTTQTLSTRNHPHMSVFTIDLLTVIEPHQERERERERERVS